MTVKDVIIKRASELCVQDMARQFDAGQFPKPDMDRYVDQAIAEFKAFAEKVITRSGGVIRPE